MAKKKVSKLFWQLILIVMVFFVLALYKVSLITVPTDNSIPTTLRTIPETSQSSTALSVDTSAVAPESEVSSFEGEADPDRMTLGMKVWNWIRSTETNGTEIKPRAEKDFSVIFKKDKTFFVNTDCNSIGGEYVVQKEIISLRKTSSTSAYCENVQESYFVDALLSATSYSFTGRGELVMTLKTGSTLTLR